VKVRKALLKALTLLNPTPSQTLFSDLVQSDSLLSSFSSQAFQLIA
jgi:hypothetical protein